MKTLPGIREAIEQGQWTTAEAQIVVVAAAVQRAADRIARAREMVDQLR